MVLSNYSGKKRNHNFDVFPELHHQPLEEGITIFPNPPQSSSPHSPSVALTARATKPETKLPRGCNGRLTHLSSD